VNPFSLTESVATQEPLRALNHIYLAKITGAELIEEQPNRWRYSMQAGYITGPEDQIEFDSLRSAVGFNVYEFDNTEEVVQGIDVDNLPEGFEFEPASGYVICSPCRMLVNDIGEGEEGNTFREVLLFCVPLSVDGECEEDDDP
tara:strand:+ start:1262 stop:1693 length:432 start_codon:yes stop_codon:yes gene_type:complete